MKAKLSFCIGYLIGVTHLIDYLQTCQETPADSLRFLNNNLPFVVQLACSLLVSPCPPIACPLSLFMSLLDLADSLGSGILLSLTSKSCLFLHNPASVPMIFTVPSVSDHCMTSCVFRAQ